MKNLLILIQSRRGKSKNCFDYVIDEKVVNEKPPNPVDNWGEKLMFFINEAIV